MRRRRRIHWSGPRHLGGGSFKKRRCSQWDARKRSIYQDITEAVEKVAGCTILRARKSKIPGDIDGFPCCVVRDEQDAYSIGWPGQKHEMMLVN